MSVHTHIHIGMSMLMVPKLTFLPKQSQNKSEGSQDDQRDKKKAVKQNSVYYSYFSLIYVFEILNTFISFDLQNFSK